MSKVVFITQNSAAIRAKLRNAGFKVCHCTSLHHAVWLIYHPEGNFFNDIHGTGYADEMDEPWIWNLSPEDRIKEWLTLTNYYAEEREFFDDVDLFIEAYKPKKRELIWQK